MKNKILLTFVLIFLILSLIACDINIISNTEDNSDHNSSDWESELMGENNNQNDAVSGGKKISGFITRASLFSEGLAFVCIDTEEVTYCINKKGEIVFEINENIFKNSYWFYGEFNNGHILINGKVCDTKGNLTSPEDVGVTKFYDFAFNGGYIIAERITSTYNSSKKELGVMDFDFKWVLEPSEIIYDAVSDQLWTSEYYNTESRCFNGYIYFEGCGKYLNISTGDIVNEIDVEIPSHAWSTATGSFYSHNGKEMLKAIEGAVDRSDFVNGKAAVLFYNDEVYTYYYTVIDDQGSFAFEPVKIEGRSGVRIGGFDGEYVLVENVIENMYYCYNAKGEFCGNLEEDGYVKLYDGVILVSGQYEAPVYYNPDFTRLFQ